ncbi:type II secretion system F family protein [Sandaracinobacter neustonicus]|uniref:Type II secretion system F family protein n=1 Tax=Sandaracinobacter neustonicus TaxID=1715348 RepID=A0A501XME3_9SPHN|nr:type II secretion system F family protein [Sandaracinobacter neustonicus]TPE61818.1 type II secretion system F family protein [Sandaracinobacter neustonicus]
MSQDMTTYLILGLVFGAVVLGVLAVAPMFGRKVDLAKRLATPAPGGAVMSGGSSQSLRNDSSASLWARLIAEVERRGISLNDDKAPVLQEKLALAGYSQPYAVRAYVLIRSVLTIVFPAITYGYLILTGSTITGSKFYLIVLGSAVLGLYLPNVIVSGRADRRQQEILNGFPDALDLMLVCVEAGLGIDACFARVGQEIVNLHPRLAELFATVSLELRAGRPRSEALKNMARKSGVQEIQSFATLVIQSDKLGASIGQALKIYAAEMRESRRMRAEEKAHRLPVLLSVPMVLFLLPVVVGTLGLPAAIQISNSSLGE